MKRTSFLLIIILLTYSSVFGQMLHYDVIRNGESMGTTDVLRKKVGNDILYHLNTKTEFRVVFLFKVEYDLKETFRDGYLIGGTSFNTLNSGVQKQTAMKQANDGYELVIDGIKTHVREDKIQESVAEIYFEEPYDGKAVYSAYFGRYLYFEQVSNHKYQLISPDGTNIYTYENGIVTEVNISRDFANFSQILKPESLAAVRSNKISSENHD